MGDCYCAAVVEALSRKVNIVKMIWAVMVKLMIYKIAFQELDAMDQLNEKLRVEEEEKLMGPTLGMHKSPSTSSNGSRVAVPEEVIRVMVLVMVKVAPNSATRWKIAFSQVSIVKNSTVIVLKNSSDFDSLTDLI